MKIIKFEDTAILVKSILYITKWDNADKTYFIMIKFKDCNGSNLQWSYKDEYERSTKYNNLIVMWIESTMSEPPRKI